MRIILFIGIFFILFFSFGIYLSLIPVHTPNHDNLNYDTKGYFDYKGVTHVHSLASTGSGTYSEILTQGQNADLNFLVVTEVNQPVRPNFVEGYFHDILVLAGGEYSYFDSRLMYYGGNLNQPPSGQSQLQIYFADLLSQKTTREDLVVLAHPFYSRYSWRGEYPTGLDGIEVINLKSIFAQSWENSKLRTIMSFLIYPFNAAMAYVYLLSFPEDELLLWDKLNTSRKTLGFAGNDSTARLNISGNKFLKFPSYETSFNLVSNHILTQSELTGQFIKDKTKVLNALKDGNFYFSFDLLGNPKGFVVEVTDGKKSYLQGSDIELKTNTKLTVELPNTDKPVQVRIIKDGEEFSISTSHRTVLNINTPGIYRVEVYVSLRLPLPGGKKWLPWIFSNNFYISD